jgi:uncharacterized pyridoxamine 5'-phosphate oxidase family protein
MQDVYDFLKKCGTYYLATVEGKLYIQTGKVKAASKQMMANPKVEICAFNGDEWIRVQATVVADERLEAKQSMLDAYPSLSRMYSATDDNTQVLYLKDAVATIASFGGAPKVIEF